MDKDVTAQCEFYDNDGECLPLTKCVCGQKFDPWDFIISIYRTDPAVCKYCGRKLYFENQIAIYEVVD